jgi:hypothetical protein
MKIELYQAWIKLPTGWVMLGFFDTKSEAWRAIVYSQPEDPDKGTLSWFPFRTVKVEVVE